MNCTFNIYETNVELTFEHLMIRTQDKIIKYLSSKNGNTAKFIFGSVVSASGLFISPVLVVIGLIPLLTAWFDVCLVAPIFKLPFEGEELRNKYQEK